MVVSVGSKYCPTLISSMLIMDISPGTVSPNSLIARMAPIAITSLEHKHAVGLNPDFRSSPAPRYPPSMEMGTSFTQDQSRVWLQADDVDGKIVFNAESDALIVKGIIALLIKVLSGHTPDEILNADLYFIDKIGLRDHLSPTRSNGLLSMVKQIRMYALAFKAKEGK